MKINRWAIYEWQCNNNGARAIHFAGAWARVSLIEKLKIAWWRTMANVRDDYVSAANAPNTHRAHRINAWAQWMKIDYSIRTRAIMPARRAFHSLPSPIKHMSFQPAMFYVVLDWYACEHAPTHIFVLHFYKFTVWLRVVDCQLPIAIATGCDKCYGDNEWILCFQISFLTCTIYVYAPPSHTHTHTRSCHLSVQCLEEKLKYYSRFVSTFCKNSKD